MRDLADILSPNIRLDIPTRGTAARSQSSDCRRSAASFEAWDPERLASPDVRRTVGCSLAGAPRARR